MAKVPKYEEPNALPLPGLTGSNGFGLRYGRFGHGSDGNERHRPLWPGRFFLWLLGMRRNDPEKEEATTREHEHETPS
jgi:hypothetical protein